ncbi:hypothetical protein NC651_025973 [Populus alba x Populus x berolinensis]|nr:hypothetical protein NC651_025973 [Populus alba x Populus x berolinensis]
MFSLMAFVELGDVKDADRVLFSSLQDHKKYQLDKSCYTTTMTKASLRQGLIAQQAVKFSQQMVEKGSLQYQCQFEVTISGELIKRNLKVHEGSLSPPRPSRTSTELTASDVLQ